MKQLEGSDEVARHLARAGEGRRRSVELFDFHLQPLLPRNHTVRNGGCVQAVLVPYLRIRASGKKHVDDGFLSLLHGNHQRRVAVPIWIIQPDAFLLEKVGNQLLVAAPYGLMDGLRRAGPVFGRVITPAR